jgi:hypothetical protein
MPPAAEVQGGLPISISLRLVLPGQAEAQAVMAAEALLPLAAAAVVEGHPQ